jgi:hypothetical protein
VLLSATCLFVLDIDVCLRKTAHREFVQEFCLCTFSGLRDHLFHSKWVLREIVLGYAREVLRVQWQCTFQIVQQGLSRTITSASVHCAAAP